MESLNLFIRSVFIDNILLAYFLGMCSCLLTSGNFKTAFRMGVAVCLVLILALPLAWCVNIYILAPGALSWLGAEYAAYDFSYLSLLAFIALTAGLVHLLRAVAARFIHAYNLSGRFLKYVVVNSAVLGTVLFMQQEDLGSALTAAVYGAGSGVGWLLAVTCMAAIRERLVTKAIPAPLRGTGITLIIAALMGIAFMGITGIRF